MSEETKCPFCGSSKLKLDTPYIDRVTRKPVQTFCCKAQATNATYINKRFDPSRSDAPKPEDVAKW